MSVETISLIWTFVICSIGLLVILLIHKRRRMTQAPMPLEYLLGEMDRAVEAQLYFLALTMTLALPNICVSLASEDGRSTPDQYIDWCDENLGDRFGFVTGKDLYSMRCGVVHNGRFGDLKHNVARVLFALPGTITFVNSQINDAYIYSVVEFCAEFAAAVRSWYSAHSSDPNVVSNLPRMMTVRPEGIPPYIKGCPVLG